MAELSDLRVFRAAHGAVVEAIEALDSAMEAANRLYPERDAPTLAQFVLDAAEPAWNDLWEVRVLLGALLFESSTRGRPVIRYMQEGAPGGALSPIELAASQQEGWS